MHIREEYQNIGVDGFYKIHGNNYINPHYDKLYDTLFPLKDKWSLKLNNSLDLCCGSGEITRIFNCIEGCDPYTHNNYTNSVNKPCMRFSFDDIMHGKLDKQYDTIICSYALHLADTNKLPLIIYQLSLICEYLMIISPHKKPLLKDEWGINLINEFYVNKIRVRLYKTKNVWLP